MQYYPFDSRKLLYRDKIGAVASGETLRLRLLLHNDAHCHNAYLCIRQDDNDFYDEILLEPKEYLEDYRFYDTQITLNTGLYWYHFRYESDYGPFYVSKDDGSLGIVSYDICDFQQTVFESGFDTPDWLCGGIIYQIFPDRFYKSGKQHKNIPEDRYICDDWAKQPEYRQVKEKLTLGNDYYGGDLKGIEEKLPYLKSLGVSCIYLNPIFEAHSNHHYNTADYMKIDASLGDEDDFKSLCNSAKDMGIRVILDGVFSHTGDDSIYFNKYHRYGDGGAYNDISSPYRSWYSFGDYECGYSAWWDVPSLPEVDENNPEFTEFITGQNGVIRHWLRLGASGFRLDVADELPDKFLENIRRAIKTEKADGYLLGEVWEDASSKISYGARRKFLQGKQLDSVMNYPLAEAIIAFITGQNAHTLNETVLSILENYPKCSINLLMNHIGTHDTMRILTRLIKEGEYIYDRQWQSQQALTHDEQLRAKVLLKMSAVVQYTLPGIPSLYYGDEAGIEGYGDPFCRSTYPWGKEDTKLVEFYKSLGAIRTSCDAFKDGDYLPIICDGGMLSFERVSSNARAFIAVNSGNSSYNITVPKTYHNAKNSFGSVDIKETVVLNHGDYIIITK